MAGCPDCKEVRGKFTLCEKHEAEYQATHARWIAEHRAAHRDWYLPATPKPVNLAEDLL